VGRSTKLGKGDAQQDEEAQVSTSEKQKPDPTVARANKRLASRRLRDTASPAGQYLQRATRRPSTKCC